MREIKFRAWDNEKKIMGNSACLEDIVLKASKQNPKTFHWDYDIPIMQYIGQKDDSGKEIYEGDIIKQSWSKPKEEDTIGVVVYDEEEGMYKTNYKNGGSIMYHKTMSREIIGNIYENPKLL